MRKFLLGILLLTLAVVAFSSSRVTITMTAGAVGKELEVLYAQLDVFMRQNRISKFPSCLCQTHQQKARPLCYLFGFGRERTHSSNA